MTQPKITYLGPSKALSSRTPERQRQWWSRIPVPFVVVVVLPTIVAAIYLFLVATPRYVSEAIFVVRAPTKSAPSSLGAALQGVGLSTGSSDAYAVHEYIRSADGFQELARTVDVKVMYSRPGVDVFSKLPRPFSDPSSETFRSEFNRYVTVGYDSQTGISTLRVEAFRASDAQTIAEAMLKGGEGLVNRLNERSADDAVNEARQTLEDAQKRLSAAQSALTSYRSREGIIDPARAALAGSELMGQLTLNLATLRAERAQVASDTPQSPQLQTLDSRIRALGDQIEAEKGKIVGDPGSLADKMSAYENLVMEREFSDRLVATATAALNSAQLDARRQNLYIERIVNPTLTDKPTEPKALLGLLAVLATCLVIYSIGWLVWAGISESKLDE